MTIAENNKHDSVNEKGKSILSLLNGIEFWSSTKFAPFNAV